MTEPTTPGPDKLVSELVREDPGLHDLVEEFVDGLSRRIIELREAFEALDWERLEMLAHRLKGAGGAYGYPDLSGVAAGMEQDCKVRRSDGLDDRMRALEQLTAAAHAGLRAH